MSTFYEILDISTNATPEEVRKAYKKKALRTHPDRLGPNASAQDKADAEEKFREVNNAYEVLNDPERRQLYDKHGIWPPPQESSHRPSTHHSRRHDRPAYYHQTFTDPFEHFHHHFHNEFPNMRQGHFVDVNDLFRSMDTMFNNMNAIFNQSFAPAGAHYGHFAPAPVHGGFSQPMPGFDISLDPGHSRHVTTFTSSTRIGGATETYEETIVNGVKRSVHKKVDRNGNVHCTATDGRGRKTYTINGVPQQPGLLPDAHRPPMPLPMDHHSRSSSKSNGSHNSRHKSSSSRRHTPEYEAPPPYQPDVYRDRPRDTTRDHHHHRYHNTVPVVYSSDDSDYDDYSYNRHHDYDYDRSPRRSHHRHESGIRKWWPFSH